MKKKYPEYFWHQMNVRCRGLSSSKTQFRGPDSLNQSIIFPISIYIGICMDKSILAKACKSSTGL